MDKRERMVEVMKDRYGLDAPEVFAAMLQVDRDEFVAKKYRNRAYNDNAVPIEHGQTMSQPYTVAFMTDLLGLKGNERVLEIGTGSGYQAAILSLLAKEVYTIEIIRQLASRAKKRLKKLGYNNVEVGKGSGEWGWKERAPFDAIIITAGMTMDLHQEIIDQLNVGGVLVAPVGRGHDKTMTKFTKLKNGKTKKQKFGVFTFVPFISEPN